MQFDITFFLDFVFNPRPALLRGLLTTVLVAFASMVIGVVLGLVLSLFGLSRLRVLRWFNSVYIFVFRGTPLLVQVIIIYFGLPYLTNIDLFPQDFHLFGFISLSGTIVAGVTAFALHEAAFFQRNIPRRDRVGRSRAVGRWQGRGNETEAADAENHSATGDPHHAATAGQPDERHVQGDITLIPDRSSGDVVHRRCSQLCDIQDFRGLSRCIDLLPGPDNRVELRPSRIGETLFKGVRIDMTPLRPPFCKRLRAKPQISRERRQVAPGAQP